MKEGRERKDYDEFMGPRQGYILGRTPSTSHNNEGAEGTGGRKTRKNREHQRRSTVDQRAPRLLKPNRGRCQLPLPWVNQVFVGESVILQLCNFRWKKREGGGVRDWLLYDQNSEWRLDHKIFCFMTLWHTSNVFTLISTFSSHLRLRCRVRSLGPTGWR